MSSSSARKARASEGRARPGHPSLSCCRDVRVHAALLVPGKVERHVLEPQVPQPLDDPFAVHRVEGEEHAIGVSLDPRDIAVVPHSQLP